MKEGKLIVISGASGVGKGTVLGIMMQKRSDLSFSVSATTRAPRPGEVDGVHYHFLSREQFQKWVDEDAFLDTFFSVAFSPDRCRCILDHENLQAVLYWFDATCENQKFAYLYAVATDPASRGRGLCRMLMEDTRRYTDLRGRRPGVAAFAAAV